MNQQASANEIFDVFVIGGASMDAALPGTPLVVAILCIWPR